MAPNRRIPAAILVTFFACAPAAAQEELIDGSNPDGVMRAARQYGSAALASQPDGNPMVTGRIDGIPYNVHFRNCMDASMCKDINFRVGFLSKLSLETINGWNRTKRFARAYLDGEGDAILEMDVVLDGGVSEANMSEIFAYWRLSMKQFTSYIDAGD